jgi:hypothetical protein
MTRPRTKRVCSFCHAQLKKTDACCCSVRPCRHTAHLTPVHAAGYTPLTPMELQRAMEGEGHEVGYRVAWKSWLQVEQQEHRTGWSLNPDVAEAMGAFRTGTSLWPDSRGGQAPGSPVQPRLWE